MTNLIRSVRSKPENRREQNTSWFVSLADVPEHIEAWIDYYTEQAYLPLGHLTASGFARQAQTA